MCRSAFTLIELLVVVTIIVVLLSLLTPALDKAIYQAELAVCGSRQHAIAAGAITYAIGSKRFYPDRAGVRTGVIWHAAWIYNGNDALNAAYGGGAPGGYANPTLGKCDDRGVLRTFLSLNGHLNDPLTGRLDFESVDADATVYAHYALWFGYQYLARTGMFKIGDRFGGRGDSNGIKYYNLLVSDRDNLQLASLRTQTAHPDADGKTANTVLQNQQFNLQATGTAADSSATLKLTFSTWSSLDGRGDEDLNYGFQDGSVRRYDHVKRSDAQTGKMERLPDLSDRRIDWDLTVPPQNQ